ncbi:MAG TPA: tetratricopeptide repeat protein, partial [Gemmatimonadales bacterium]
MTSLKPSEPWYVARGRRGQELLDQGRIPEAVETFAAVLESLGSEAGYGRAVVLERLGRALLLAGDHDGAFARLREALDVAGRIAPSDTVRRLRCTLRSDLGDALRSVGRPEEARRAYLAALELGRELRDRRSEGVDQARLGALALAQGDTGEALERYRGSLDALRRLKEPAVEAVAWDELGRLYRELGDWPQAARHLREAVECERRCGPSLRLARRLLALAGVLREVPAGLEEAREAAEQALAVAQGVSPLAAEVWAAYGLLGEILPERGDLRELARRAPLIVEVAERLGPSPSLGRAVILGRLGRCAAAGGRPDLAATSLREALRVAERLPESEGQSDLSEMLRGELGAVEALLAPASSPRVTVGFGDASAPEPRGLEAALGDDGDSTAITILERTDTDYAFEPNLLLDGPRTRRVVSPADHPTPPAEDIRPVLVPGTRTWLDAEGRIRLVPPAGEPRVRVEGECTVLRRTSREVTLAGGNGLVWRLLAAMDGRAPWGAILAALSESERVEANRVISVLAGAGVVDLSGRPLGRFIHWTTRKGVIPAGGLEGDEVLRLASDRQTHGAGRLIP